MSADLETFKSATTQFFIGYADNVLLSRRKKSICKQSGADLIKFINRKALETIQG